MRKAPVVALAAALAVPIIGAAIRADSAAGVAYQPGAAAATCKPGLRTVRGVKVYVYCGPAKATVKFAGTTIRFTSGACVRAVGGTWAINVGTATVPPKQPRYKYFGITIGKLAKAGQYKKAAIGFQWKGKSYGVPGGVVTVKGKMSGGVLRVTGGTFTGRLDQGARPKVSGSFTC